MKFSLQALELSVKLGITSQEQQEPQMVLADIDYEYDVSGAIKSDHIQDTLDYQQVYDAVKKLSAEGSWDLLETLHAELKNMLLQQFKDMKALTVTLTKFPFEDGAVVVKG